MTALVGTDAAKLPCLSQILNLLCYSSSGNTQLFRKFVIRACWFFGKNLKYFQGTFQGTFLHTFPSTFLRIAPPLLSARSGRHITMRKPLGTSSRSGVLSPLALHTSKRSVNPVPIVHGLGDHTVRYLVHVVCGSALSMFPRPMARRTTRHGLHLCLPAKHLPSTDPQTASPTRCPRQALCHEGCCAPRPANCQRPALDPSPDT